ncbi:unnamed protein product [Ectocarpus sp. CCAP 1310/34]|nr:unnamed protein product [Ectocarpus sp. CCAP 1310/34]
MTLETDGEDQVFVLLCRRVPVLEIVDCAIPHATTYNLTMGPSFWSCCVPLNALGNPVFEKFLAHVNVNLPSSGHLAEHIPLILEEEQAKIRDEMGDRPNALCFDATPYLCEWFRVGVRFINASGQVAQRVLRLSMLKKSMTADDIAGEVTRIVTHEYGLDPVKCRAIKRDSCAANLLAMDALAKLFRYAVVISCLPPTFNNIAKQLCTPELDTFLGKMHTLLSHSAGAKALFKEKVGVRAPSTPGHRWGSRFDRDYIIAMNWPGVLKFIAAYESADTDKSKAAKFMRDELVRVRDDNKAQSLVLQLHLALMVDVGCSVTSATIVLEGDEPFDDLDTLRQYAHDRVGRHSQAREAKTLEMFKAAKLTDFVFMKSKKYSDDTMRSLKVLPFVKSKMVRGLLKEKEDYYMAASDTDIEDELVRVRDDNKAQSLVLQLHLALMVDVGRSVTSATIVLEGDEPLAHKTYNVVERFRSKFELAEDGVFSEDVSLPTVAALLDQVVGQGDDLDDLDTLRQYAHDRVGRHSQAREAKTLEMFKAAKLTDFVFMKSKKYSDDTIRSLKVLPFVKSKMVRGLLKEKEDYYMAASDTDIEYGHMAFWDDNKKRLPTWHALVLDVALLQPCSAFMERVFSILRCCFNERQEHVYTDLIGAAQVQQGPGPE